MVVRLGDIADVVLGAENYDEDVRFNGQTATFMGIWVLPTANSLDVIKQRPRGHAGDPGAAPGRHEGGHPLRLDRIHPGRDQRGGDDADRDAPDRRHRHLPLPGLVPVGADPGRGDPDLAGRRGLPDAGRRLHHQPADAARDRALGRSRRRRRDRHGRERRAAPPRGQEAVRRGHQGRARAGRPDHRDDHHAGRGLRADRHPGRPDGRAVPRVRLHAGRRGHHLGRRGADAVADDGAPGSCARATPSAGSPAGSTAASTASARATRACWPAPSTTGRSS